MSSRAIVGQMATSYRFFAVPDKAHDALRVGVWLGDLQAIEILREDAYAIVLRASVAANSVTCPAGDNTVMLFEDRRFDRGWPKDFPS